ncbi:hypothetical protein GIB67_039236, partial [Kingdonia uniflora]
MRTIEVLEMNTVSMTVRILCLRKTFKTENNQKPRKFGFKHILHIMKKHLRWNPEIVHRSVHKIQV